MVCKDNVLGFMWSKSAKTEALTWLYQDTSPNNLKVTALGKNARKIQIYARTILRISIQIQYFKRAFMSESYCLPHSKWIYTCKYDLM